MTLSSLLLHALLLCALLLPCACVSPLVVAGKWLLDSATRRRFFVQGSGYDYDVSNDNRAQWRPAVNALFTAAPHINAIRLYEVDPAHQYDEFMLDMQRRGVYVVVPLTPSHGWCTLSRPYRTHSHNPSLPFLHMHAATRLTVSPSLSCRRP